MTSGRDGERFVELLAPHRGSLERYARRVLRDPSRAEDVLQDSILAALQRFPYFEDGTSFRAWIFRFVTFGALNANRKLEPVWLSEIPMDLEVDEELADSEAVEVFEHLINNPLENMPPLQDPLNQALAKLTAPERACLLLRAIGEFDYHEIHELLDIPRGSVMGYLSRARKRMRLFLSEYAQEHGWIREQAKAAEERCARQGRTL